ncbi:MAG: SsrA-binding protein SmpB [Candidatus Dojkabacteria bacterium]
MKALATNKKALFNYISLDEYEAGLALKGWEVKSIKSGNVSLKESYVTLRDNEAWLVGAHVARWPGMGQAEPGVETRERKLLLHRSEISKLQTGLNQRGHTLIPIDMHMKGNVVKLRLALARGKKLHDKRQKLKEKDQKRSIERDIKNFGLKE